MKLTYFKALILLMCLIPLMTTAQSSQHKRNDAVLALLEKYISEKNSNSIYALGSKKYKTKSNKQKTEEFLKEEVYPLGKISKSSFISFKKNVSKYKVVFAAGKIQLSFSLDKDNKLNELDFAAFEPVVTIKPLPVATSNPLKSALDKSVDSIARVYIQQSNTVGLNIGVLKDGQTYIYGYGETEKGKGQIPSANAIFEIGSVTKVFTSVILAHYVNLGKISLTDPITKYLPDSVAVNQELQKITIVNLSNHTSGLPRLPKNLFEGNTDAANPYKNYTDQLLFAYLKRCKLASVPGEVYAYSNSGTGLLGVILERISGKTYEELVKEVITDPLKMESTFQKLTPELAKRFVKVYDNEAEEVKAWDLDALAASGCLRSTVTDLLIFANSNLGIKDTDLSKSLTLTHEITFSKGDNILGLGWHILDLEGDNYHWHNGGTGGSRSFLIINVKKKIAVVVLSNSDVGVDEVGVGILEKIL